MRSEPKTKAPISLEARVGRERVNSPAKGLLTMFLEGKLKKSHVVALIDAAQETKEVMAFGLHLSHLHFGTDGSFTGDSSAMWIDTVRYFLREGFWCTLEVKPVYLPLISKTGICRQSRFIPLVRVPIPSALQLGYNATLEVTDNGNDRCWGTPLVGFLQQYAKPKELETIYPTVKVQTTMVDSNGEETE